MRLQENIMFANRYKLERLLGKGGFSEVWLATDTLTKLQIALKVYAPGQGMDSDGLVEFSKELAGVYNLNHSNLLKPQHVDAWEGMPYLIMSYCADGSLMKKVGKMVEGELWKVIYDVSAGLEYLHRNNIVHQDIKPENILIDSTGTYVITDFGISTNAQRTLRKSMNMSIDALTSIDGTMPYMGPERFSKQPAPTKASDIWSLGAMMFELITSSVPFGATGGGLQKGGADIPDIDENVSDLLKQTIESMLAKETWDRPTAEKLMKIAKPNIGRNDINNNSGTNIEQPEIGRKTARLGKGEKPEHPQPPTNESIVQPKNLVFSAGGTEAQEISINYYGEWSAIISKETSWIKVSKKSENTICVTCNKNDSGKNRHGKIKIATGGEMHVVDIKQESAKNNDKTVRRIITSIAVIIVLVFSIGTIYAVKRQSVMEKQRVSITRIENYVKNSSIDNTVYLEYAANELKNLENIENSYFIRYHWKRTKQKDIKEKAESIRHDLWDSYSELPNGQTKDKVLQDIQYISNILDKL